MGLVERLHLLAANITKEEEIDQLIQSTEKVATGSMGSKFKFIAITHPTITTPGFSEL
jgi:SAM-dependent MidA family methyltransferase